MTKTVGIKVGPNAAELLPADTAESVAQETVLYPLLEGDKYNQALLGGDRSFSGSAQRRGQTLVPQLSTTLLTVKALFATAERNRGEPQQ